MSIFAEMRNMDKKVELVAAGGVEQFRVVECMPEPPGRHEIRVRQQAAGVNYLDIYHRSGLYSLPLPAVLGVEGAGVVEAVGDEVSQVCVGDRIVYAGIAGGYASTRLLPAWRAIKLPQDIEPKVVAGVFLRGLTAQMLLNRTVKAENGMVLLVHAAAGGLGTSLVRWAKALGCTVIGTVGTPQKADIARSNGVDHVIVGRDADLVAEVRAVTGGNGVDYVIDGIGGDMLKKSLACARKFGTVASIGQSAGPIPPVAVEDLGPIRSLSLARPSVMAYAADPQAYAVAARDVIRAVHDGIIQDVGQDYDLTDVARAHVDLENGRTTGRIRLLMPGK